MSDKKPRLAVLLERWQTETDEMEAAVAESRKQAEAMFSRLIGMGVDDLRQARRAVLAMTAMLDEMELIEHRDHEREARNE